MQGKTINEVKAETELAWIDGVEADSVPILDRGFNYGHGVFETIAVIDRIPALLPQHLNRLRLGCERLKIPIVISALQLQIDKFIEQAPQDTGILKLIVTAGTGGRGYASPKPINPRIILIWLKPPQFSADFASTGILVRLSSVTIARQPLLAGLKHLNRLEQILARHELDQLDGDYQEGLMTDADGYLVEGIMSNIFLLFDNQLVTPSLQNSGVKGVMREHIMSQAQLFFPELLIEERPVLFSELKLADELFVCNSLIGIWPITRVHSPDGTFEFEIGAKTKRLQTKIKSVCFLDD